MSCDYYCHVCNSFIHPSHIRHSQNDEVLCIICNRPGFVEKIERDETFVQSFRQQASYRQSRHDNSRGSFMDPFAEVLGVPFQQLINDLYHSSFPLHSSTTATTDNVRSGVNESDNGMQYFHVDWSVGNPNRQQFRFTDLASLLGQFMINPDDNSTMNQIIQFIMENDSNRHGSPPAAAKVVNNLKRHKLSKEESEKLDSCAICHEDYQEGDEVHYLCTNHEICNHCFHVDCIIPWLKEHNSCPVCRYELPTDDPEYDSRRADLRERIAHQVTQAAQAARTDGSDNSRSSTSNTNNQGNTFTATTAGTGTSSIGTSARNTAAASGGSRRIDSTFTFHFPARSQRSGQNAATNQSFSRQYIASRRMVPLSFDPLDIFNISRQRPNVSYHRSGPGSDYAGCRIQ
ncbi:E3 ubiquitin-protein ligase RING1 [Babesia microti strain RI]|uniref:E3 ubiquitin-protein ligase RING1 n=1 Tax=Babesia microti (strain RI) TaxID=1133968 RepID=A0A0K3AUH5_BABMR|nr:E3 ubiquitin-protein ligase RING1 [Babesia microti strain RI]CTQ41246.1 E3 ubiquitin-protein ligase RING1 [Babesia microti strain RI]|eukprot:XP_012649257.1 E3 ubiquitin-protein ligase RING1 [Babesia microti strain RI]